LAAFDASRTIARTGFPASRNAFHVENPTFPVAPTIANIFEVVNGIRWKKNNVIVVMLDRTMRNPKQGRLSVSTM
jgi:hypothetical protein